MAGRREDTIRRILDLEEEVHRSVGHGDPVAWRDSELGTGQLKALFVLRASGPMRIGAVGDALKVKKASISETVDRLVSQGLAVREQDPDDHRAVRVALTSEGSDLADRLRASGGARTARLLEVMDDLELDHVRLGLEAMGRAAQRLEDGGEP